MSRHRSALAAVLAVAAVAAGAAHAAAPEPAAYRPHVVVATLDTGTNPFHPAWRRSQHGHPSTFIRGYPTSAKAARLSFKADQEASVAASEAALEVFATSRHPVWIPGTNIVGTWAHASDQLPIFDANDTDAPTHSHGASASSQIAGRGLGMAEDAYVVIMDRTSDGGVHPYEANADGLRWAADQPWIDIIHTNIQNPVPLAQPSTPLYPGYADAVAYALSKGKLVVSAGGNFYAEATETSPHAGPPGVLVAGANDNCGWTTFSNPDPHVVMDGADTVAASPTSFETTSFGGTSSASPRISGYVAELLLRLRRHYRYAGGVEGGALLRLARSQRRPATGPLADGQLTAAELHEVVRKTADPRSHRSTYDGKTGFDCVPEPAAGPAYYPKVGYGEVSEHTIGAAFAVATGNRPMPARPDEDRFYEQSEALRSLFWG
ncbi:MAG TPA: S8/S53 family peptidase [Mycobacteriales bacterium]|nr:S8/S53 family peptidase [Mycobacteriales bacterium]